VRVAHRAGDGKGLGEALVIPESWSRMPEYAPHLKVREARQRYFERGGFGNGGYEDRWVRLKAGPLVIRFPNTKARLRAVKLHDLHHVLTEYDTSWSGEAEISAWEIATGCGRHYAAWVLNFGAVAVGLFIAPRAVYAAFLRGRQTTSLYGGKFEEALLERTVGEERTALGLDSSQRPTRCADRLAFLAWVFVSVAWTVFPLIAAVWLVLAVIRSVGV
jgi:hypothetical protein